MSSFSLINMKQFFYKKKIIVKKQSFPNNNICIPFHIYQTWHDKNNIPPSVSECVSNIIKNNPTFTHHLCDTHECREFIKNNFPPIVLDTYDILIPHAFKADLWRYCVLYVCGGIYLDVKYSCINNFDFTMLTNTEYFCKDLDSSLGGIYNAIIICKPKNEILLKSIYKIVENARKEYYGETSLCPTGPLMMKRFFSGNEINNFKLKLNYEPTNGDIFITFNNNPILFFNKKYRNDQKNICNHWTTYWIDRNIYNKDLPQYTNVAMYNKDERLMGSIFTQIYEERIWGNNNNANYSGSSGGGSILHFNKNTYVPFLKNFINNNNIKSIIDLGCGDFICGPSIYDDLKNITYYGYDVYEKIIIHHKQTHLLPKYNFTTLDFYSKKEEITPGDLCILKDVIMHWSLKAINTFLDYLVENNLFKYILICNCCNQTEDNPEILTGSWRELSCDFYPLKKYNAVKMYNFNSKEVSVIINTSGLK